MRPTNHLFYMLRDARQDLCQTAGLKNPPSKRRRSRSGLAGHYRTGQEGLLLCAYKAIIFLLWSTVTDARIQPNTQGGDDGGREAQTPLPECKPWSQSQRAARPRVIGISTKLVVTARVPGSCRQLPCGSSH